jgi:hypothetical protein
LACAIPRVYYLMRCTHNALQGVIVNSFESIESYFGCVCCFWQDLQDFTLLDCMCIPFQYFMDFVVSWRHEWLGAEGSSGTNWLPCPVEMLRWLSFIFNIALLCLQWFENKNPVLVFLHVFTIDHNYWSLLVLLLSLFRGYFCAQRVHSILFSLVCKHEITIFMSLVSTLVCTIIFETSVQYCLSLLFEFLLTFVVK